MKTKYDVIRRVAKKHGVSQKKTHKLLLFVIKKLHYFGERNDELAVRLNGLATLYFSYKDLVFFDMTNRKHHLKVKKLKEYYLSGKKEDVYSRHFRKTIKGKHYKNLYFRGFAWTGDSKERLDRLWNIIEIKQNND